MVEREEMEQGYDRDNVYIRLLSSLQSWSRVLGVCKQMFRHQQYAMAVKLVEAMILVIMTVLLSILPANTASTKQSIPDERLLSSLVTKDPGMGVLRMSSIALSDMDGQSINPGDLLDQAEISGSTFQPQDLHPSTQALQ